MWGEEASQPVTQGHLDKRQQNTKLAPPSHPLTNYLKAISDLNVRAKSIKVLKENTGVNLKDLVFSNAFLDMTPKAEAKKNKQTQTR